MKAESTQKWGRGRTYEAENTRKIIFGFKGARMLLLPKITEFEEVTEWLLTLSAYLLAASIMLL